MTDLAAKHCKSCEGLVQPLNHTEAKKLMPQLKGWELDENATFLSKVFSFKNFYETMAFVNAIAWVAHQENHHPDLIVGYNECKISYYTHAIKGLSDNDFICAAKIDRILS